MNPLSSPLSCCLVTRDLVRRNAPPDPAMSPMDLDLLLPVFHPATPRLVGPQQDRAWPQIAQRFGFGTGIEQACLAASARCVKAHLSVAAPLVRSAPPSTPSRPLVAQGSVRSAHGAQTMFKEQGECSAPQRLLDPLLPHPECQRRVTTSLHCIGVNMTHPCPSPQVLKYGVQLQVNRPWKAAPPESVRTRYPQVGKAQARTS